MIRKRKRGKVPEELDMPSEWTVLPKFIKPPPAPDGYEWRFDERARWFYLHNKHSIVLWFTTTPHNKPAIGIMNDDDDDDYGWTYDKKDAPDVVAYMLSIRRLKEGGHV